MSPPPTVSPQQYINHNQMALELFTLPSQQWIPFLGAGVSTSAAPPAPEMEPRTLDPRIQSAMGPLQSALGLREEQSLFFLQSALELAIELERRPALPDDLTVLADLINRNYPPSAHELAEVFRGGISAFESVAENLGRVFRYREHEEFVTDTLTQPTTKIRFPVRKLTQNFLDRLAPLGGISAPPLSVMSSHFELTNTRTMVLRKIRDILEHKSTITPTHTLVARAAAKHLAANKSHYLIITTNYDCLMEKALKANSNRFRVPYVVLHTSKRGRDFVVRARFGNMRKDIRKRFEKVNQVKTPQVPDSWNLRTPELRHGEPEPPCKHLVIIYKLHGCIHDILRCPRFHRTRTGNCDPCPHDGIVLSDEDYIRSIAALARTGGVIPAEVVELMRNPRILFLGYSLRDWNVRGLLHALREEVNANASLSRPPDRAIVRSLTRLEETFFLNNNVEVWITDLNDFSNTVNWCASQWQLQASK